MMREAQVEAILGRGVETLGGLSLKWFPSIAGLPDRLVLLPGGRVFMVEVKTDTGRLSKIQRHRQEQLRALGFDVVTLCGPVEVRAWVASLAQQA